MTTGSLLWASSVDSLVVRTDLRLGYTLETYLMALTRLLVLAWISQSTGIGLLKPFLILTEYCEGIGGILNMQLV